MWRSALELMRKQRRAGTRATLHTSSARAPQAAPAKSTRGSDARFFRGGYPADECSRAAADWSGVFEKETHSIQGSPRAATRCAHSSKATANDGLYWR